MKETGTIRKSNFYNTQLVLLPWKQLVTPEYEMKHNRFVRKSNVHNASPKILLPWKPLVTPEYEMKLERFVRKSNFHNASFP